jgi:uncharacterized protein YggU (UPF0235/DUF167 family)
MPDRPGPLRPHGAGIEIDAWVVPRSERPGIDGMHGGMIRIRVASPPDRGRANAEAAALLASAVGGREGNVVRGRSSRRKVITVSGVDAAAAADALRRGGVAV